MDSQNHITTEEIAEAAATAVGDADDESVRALTRSITDLRRAIDRAVNVLEQRR